MFLEYDSQLKVHISLKNSFYGMFDAFKGAYWISSNCEFFQYCDSNIGLFSIACHLVTRS